MVNRRDDILREAARLFREQGYNQTSVREIANAVKMQSGSLFYHFKTKEEILVEVMGIGIDGLAQNLELALETAQTPRDKLQAILTVHLMALLDKERDAVSVYLYEWRNLSPEAQTQLIEQRDGYEKRVNVILREVANAGLISQDVKLFRLFVLGALNWTAEWYSPDGALTAEQIAQRYLTFILCE